MSSYQFYAGNAKQGDILYCSVKRKKAATHNGQTAFLSTRHKANLSKAPEVVLHTSSRHWLS
jgi:hypothetical protein